MTTDTASEMYRALFVVAVIANALQAIVMLRLFSHHEKVVVDYGKEREKKHALANDLQAIKLALAEKGIDYKELVRC